MLKKLIMRRYRQFAPLLDLAGAVYGDAMLLYDALDRRNEAVRDEVARELGRVLGARNVFELWSNEKAFEAEFAAWCGNKRAIGMPSCTAALQLALVASGVGPGDEVITSAHTFVATALAIANTGARPVLVDAETGALGMTADAVARALSPRVKAIMPVHMHGHPVDMPPILALADEHGLAVVEDCAQAAGACVGGQRLPVGRTGCFSFFPTKPLGGAGNGGMVVTDDEALAERIERARDPEGNDAIVLAGKRTPGYLNAMEIAVLRAKLPRLADWTARREAIAQRYLEALDGVDGVRPLNGTSSAWASFVIRVDERDRVKRDMLLAGVETRVEYAPPFFESATFTEMGWNAADYPVAVDAARRGLSLPVHPFLTDEEQARVVRAVRKALGRR